LVAQSSAEQRQDADVGSLADEAQEGRDSFESVPRLNEARSNVARGDDLQKVFENGTLGKIFAMSLALRDAFEELPTWLSAIEKRKRKSLAFAYTAKCCRPAVSLANNSPSPPA
jgi:hypothetical protein